MIKGVRFWSDRSRYYRQDNNPTEEILRKSGVKKFLETCGPTSAVMCLDAVGVPVTIATPGGYKPQPEEILSDYFNDPANYKALENVRSDVKAGSIPGGRVPQWYPIAIKAVFGVEPAFSWTKDWSAAVSHLAQGDAIQLCLKAPGHFIAAVAFDDATKEIIYHDPWPARVGGDGFCRRMKQDEYEKNIQPYMISYAMDLGKK